MMRDHRTEAFVAEKLHLGCDLVDDVRAHQHAIRFAAGQRARALAERVLDQALAHARRSCGRPRRRAASCLRAGRRTAIDAAFARELCGKSVGDRVDDDDPLGRHADLALVHERAERGGLDRFVEIGVLEHDQRRLAAKFEQHRLQMLGRALGDDLADPVEPVKLIRRTAGWSISAPTTSPASSGALVTRLTTPSGKPASAKPRRSAHGCAGRSPMP